VDETESISEPKAALESSTADSAMTPLHKNKKAALIAQGGLF
jgi:hypothetical protein